jgi:hypothetical protein
MENPNQAKGFFRKLLGTRLIDIAANDQWMVCYCLTLTLLEWQVIPFLKTNLFGDTFPLPTHNLPDAIVGLYMFVAASLIGLGCAALSIFSSSFLLFTVLRCIALCSGTTHFGWYPAQQGLILQEEVQTVSVRLCRFFGLLPFQIGVIWVSWKNTGFLWNVLTEFTKTEVFRNLFSDTAVYTTVLALAPLVMVYGILTLRRVAQHPGLQRWIRARLPIV